MCGIFGFSNLIVEEQQLGKLFSQSLHHRGPDDQGIFISENSCVGNTRLSIIDIQNSIQPFVSKDEKIAVVQNGEIYNYVEVRQYLKSKGMTFTSEGDTEVILNAYAHWGHKFVSHLNGMFAIAIFDTLKNKIFLYRDRIGVKPLYIYQHNDEFMFSSEIKSFYHYKNFNKKLNSQSIYDYLTFNYIPIPNTMYYYVNHLMPGQYMVYDIGKRITETFQYWDLSSIQEDYSLTLEDCIEQSEYLLRDSVKIRLRSDVEVGSFLSGGIDSSLVVANMKDLSANNKINAYCIGFNETKFDESGHAKYVSDLLDLNLKINIATPEITQIWPHITFHNDQPHGDISFIPTFILSEYASKDLKVVLSGDGGDELYGGYTKYLFLNDNENLKDYFNFTSLFNKKQLTGILENQFLAKIDQEYPFQTFSNLIKKSNKNDILNKILYFETKQLLPGNNLVKPDKMAMANSLEVRSPLLDYRLFEFSNSVSGIHKIMGGETKYILKKMARKYFKRSHVYRPKQMFTVPIGDWFRTDLKNYLFEIINSESFKSRGIFKNNIINDLADKHTKNKQNYTRELRAIINLEIWFRQSFDQI